MARSVVKAIVPVGGLGTRLLPATKAQPKEMLPVAGRPVVQHVVEELARSGARDLLFVTARGKASIENHFDDDPSLAALLRDSGKSGPLRSLRFSRRLPNLFYTRQSMPRGLGDAILHGESFAGNEPFIVALGDSIIGLRGDSMACRRMAAAFLEERADVAIAVEEVQPAQVGNYGIVDPAVEGGEVFPIRSVVEKPRPGTAPSRLAVAGRYIFSSAIFGEIRRVRPDSGGEVQITDAIRSVAENGGLVIGVRLRSDEKRYDIGSPQSYYETFVEFALADPEHGGTVREHLQKRLRVPVG